MTNLPAIPAPTSLSTPSQITQAGASIVAWAEGTEDLGALREAAAKWAAITEYVRQTSKDGIAEAEGVKRRLEKRIGVLIGPAPDPAETGRRAHQKNPQVTEGSPAGEPSNSVPKNDRSDFRKMAAHEDVVEAVIAASTDDSPPTRAKVLDAIKAEEPVKPPRRGMGERIMIALRSDVDAFVRERAEANGESPSAYIERQMERAYATHQARQANAGPEQQPVRQFPNPKAGVSPIPKTGKARP